MSQDILLIDDDSLFRRSLAYTLGRAGYSTRTAGTADEGLDLARQAPPDLVLLDIGLPGIDGLGRAPHAPPGPSHAGHPADGPPQRSGRNARPHARRRRLCQEAVRHRRAAGPHLRRAAPRASRPAGLPRRAAAGPLRGQPGNPARHPHRPLGDAMLDLTPPRLRPALPARVERRTWSCRCPRSSAGCGAPTSTASRRCSTSTSAGCASGSPAVPWLQRPHRHRPPGRVTSWLWRKTHAPHRPRPPDRQPRRPDSHSHPAARRRR